MRVRMSFDIFNESRGEWQGRRGLILNRTQMLPSWLLFNIILQFCAFILFISDFSLLFLFLLLVLLRGVALLITSNRLRI